MEPLNGKERTSALLKFLGLFLVTVILVNVAIYFSLQMPEKQLALLKEENSRLKVETLNTGLWLTTVDSVRSQLERYNAEPNKIRLELEINDRINALTKFGIKDSSKFGDILTRVANAYSENLVLKKNLLNSGDCSTKIAELEKEKAELKTDLKSCKDELVDKQFKLTQLMKN